MSDNRIIPISDEQTKLAGCFGAGVGPLLIGFAPLILYVTGFMRGRSAARGFGGVLMKAGFARAAANRSTDRFLMRSHIPKEPPRGCGFVRFSASIGQKCLTRNILGGQSAGNAPLIHYMWVNKNA
jgi:hypothetical protein